MDRIVLIELLVLALLVNAAAIVFVLRGRTPAGSSRDAVVASPEAPPVAARRGTSAMPVPAEAPAMPVPAEAPAIPAPGGWSDPDDAVWSDRLRVEAARSRRYGHPAAVVAIRLDGLDALALAAGHEVASWLCGAVARNARAWSRECDLVQADDHGAIRVLLVETDESGARAYVERVSRPLVAALQDPAAVVRLSAGWAGTSAEADLVSSGRLAQARLDGTSAGWIRSAATWRS